MFSEDGDVSVRHSAETVFNHTPVIQAREFGRDNRIVDKPKYLLWVETRRFSIVTWLVRKMKQNVGKTFQRKITRLSLWGI